METSAYGRPVLLGTGIAFSILPAIAVGMRFHARRISGAPLGIDDWIMVPALVICIAMGVVQIVATEFGELGQHQTLGSDGQLVMTPMLRTYEKSKYAYQVMGTFELGVIKASILLFYRRIFTLSPYIIVNNITLGVVTAWGIAFTLVVAFQCSPVSTIWTQFELDYSPYCVNQQGAYLAIAISDLILDLFIFTLPLPGIWQLHLPMKQRFAVVGIFLLGSIVVAAGITRVIIFAQTIAFTHEDPMAYFTDITFYTADTLLWTLLENSIGIIGACLPTMRPLFRTFRSQQNSWMAPQSYNLSRRTEYLTSSTSKSRRTVGIRSSDESLSVLRDREFTPAGHPHTNEATVETGSLHTVPESGIRVQNDFYSQVA